MNRSARKTILFCVLSVGLFVCLHRLVPCGSRLLSFPLAAAHDVAGLLLLFFIPGVAMALLIPARRDMEGFELLARGFGINVILFAAVTTVAKLAGRSVGGSFIVGAALFFLAATGVLLLVRRPRIEVRVGPVASLKTALLVAALFSILFVSLSGYTTLDPSEHWLIERFAALDFEPPPAEVNAAGGAGRFVRLEDGRGSLTYVNRSGGPARVDLKILVESEAPGLFTISCGGRRSSLPVPQPFSEMGRDVCFQKHAVVAAPVELAPGENRLELRYEGRRGEPLPCVYLDFSLMDEGEFREAFLKRYRFVNYVLMYDIMEAEDFVSNLSDRPYIYHSPGTPEMQGYAVTNPPLSYMFSAFGWVLLGRDMKAVNEVAYALIASLLLVSIHLAPGTRATSIPMVLGALSLAVVLTAGVSLHFMTHFMMMCVLLSFHFMFEKRGGWCLLFAVMACISAWGGYYFCALGFLLYALLWGEWKWAIRRLAYMTLGVALFAGCLLFYGYSQGLLGPWLDIILWENLRRFGSQYLYQAGSRACFFKYALICAGFLPLALFFRNDRRGYFFLLFSLLYCATLVMAPSNEWKIHYLPTIVFPAMISASRGLTLAMQGRSRVARVVAAAITLAAAAGFAYVLNLAFRGGLIIC